MFDNVDDDQISTALTEFADQLSPSNENIEQWREFERKKSLHGSPDRGDNYDSDSTQSISGRFHQWYKQQPSYKQRHPVTYNPRKVIETMCRKFQLNGWLIGPFTFSVDVLRRKPILHIRRRQDAIDITNALQKQFKGGAINPRFGCIAEKSVPRETIIHCHTAIAEIQKFADQFHLKSTTNAAILELLATLSGLPVTWEMASETAKIVKHALSLRDGLLRRKRRPSISQAIQPIPHSVKRATGRPPLPPNQDARWYDRWHSKAFKTQKDLARDLDVPLKELRKALDRHRKRLE